MAKQVPCDGCGELVDSEELRFIYGAEEWHCMECVNNWDEWSHVAAFTRYGRAWSDSAGVCDG